jgi:xanthine dehydrogenase accessory factor
VNKELELWRFIADRLQKDEAVMLLVVAESSGSSPGRQGYKMAVDADGELHGSIGGGVMEVNLVEQSRAILSVPPAAAGSDSQKPPLQKPSRSRGVVNPSVIAEQVHRKNDPHASGMICSGKQSVIFRLLITENIVTVRSIINALENRTHSYLNISQNGFTVEKPEGKTPPVDFSFQKQTDTEFIYREKLGYKNDLYIVGGGHCALALSELMSRMDFCISLFDDRPELNTIEKNRFAHKITIIDDYEQTANHIRSGDNTYVVVMTIGFRSDVVVIRNLLDKDFKYFGVLGSRAKMKTLLNDLHKDGYPAEKLARIRTPVGLPINSQTPEEIAVSIAAEIIAVKNAAANKPGKAG